MLNYQLHGHQGCKQLAPLFEHAMDGLLDIDSNWLITNCVALSLSQATSTKSYNFLHIKSYLLTFGSSFFVLYDARFKVCLRRMRLLHRLKIYFPDTYFTSSYARTIKQ